MRGLKDLIQDENGGTAIEYGLILSLIFLALIVSVRGVATETTEMWNNVSDTVNKR